MEQKIIIVPNNIEKIRIDVFLAKNTDFSRSKIKQMCLRGAVYVNNKNVLQNSHIYGGETIKILYDLPSNYTVCAKDIAIDIVYQDNDIVIVNKPKGLPVHAGVGTGSKTLVNALLFKFVTLSNINGEIKPGIVHRLDKDTSGLLVIAKNNYAHIELAKQIEKHTCKRTYIALLHGEFKADYGRIETYIGRDKKNRLKMSVNSTGKLAITNYEVIKRYVGYTLCRFVLLTGRTHQIRVHAKYINHPIVGDQLYGKEYNEFNIIGQLLHATELKLTHPTTKQEMCFKCDSPQIFKNVLSQLKEL